MLERIKKIIKNESIIESIEKDIKNHKPTNKKIVINFFKKQHRDLYSQIKKIYKKLKHPEVFNVEVKDAKGFKYIIKSVDNNSLEISTHIRYHFLFKEDGQKQYLNQKISKQISDFY